MDFNFEKKKLFRKNVSTILATFDNIYRCCPNFQAAPKTDFSSCC